MKAERTVEPITFTPSGTKPGKTLYEHEPKLNQNEDIVISDATFQHRSDRRPHRRISRPELFEGAGGQENTRAPLFKTHLARTSTKCTSMCSITSCWKGFKLKNFLRFARKPVTKRQRAWMLMQFLAHTSASGWTTLFRTITGFSTPGPLQRLCFRTDACAGFTGSERFRRVKAGLQADKHSDGV